MILFLKTIQVLSIILAIISIPLIFVGFGILIFIPMVAVAFATEKAIKAHKNNIPMTAGVHTGYIFACIAGGLGCGFGVYFLGALGNIDTTGKPTTSSAVPGFIVAALVTILLIIIGGKVRNQEPPSEVSKIDTQILPNNDSITIGNVSESTKSSDKQS